jgi:hypothetical protein
MEILAYRQKLQNAATSGNGSPVNAMGYAREHTFYIEPSSTGISAGAVQIETASNPSGPWAPLGPEQSVAMTTLASIVVNQTGTFRWLRARISSNVAGGTVTVMAEGN